MSEATLTPDTAAQPLAHDLILLLADSKRLLGTRYAEWILGAPELETAIACASMAQDEWGHARLLYALLKDFGADVDQLEHGRAPTEYCNIDVLDRAPENWADLVAINAMVDTALTVQLHALTDSTYAPLRQRVAKLIDEERFHAAHGLAWTRRLARTPPGKTQLQQALQRVVPGVLRWFGPETEAAHAAVASGLVGEGPDALRQRWQDAVATGLQAGDAVPLASVAPDFNGFDVRTRRKRGSAPDAETIERVRGDRNRAFLMD
ncbi:MAG: 1,2-phenylacetyl-CoA epoxidase subunit PaaC [Longimicrobiales bacterium]